MDELEYYRIKDNRSLRCGYTTGSCAAAAAKAAAQILFGGKPVSSVSLVTPKGVPLCLSVLDISQGENWASCAVRKNSGDDPDVTNGVLVYAKVWRIPEPAITIDGGLGVGRVTKPGLEQPVGSAAINRIPRQMIVQELEAVRDETGYSGGFQVEISIPAGVGLAKKTFNPRLGIAGGISVLGTSGIVEPMSDQALVDSIRAELNVLAASGKKYVLITPGNYGETFAAETLRLSGAPLAQCSNFIGDTLDLAGRAGFRGVLLAGHIGKLVKLAGGMMNTHSRYGDCRMEILAAHAALAGTTPEQIRKILDSATTDQALDLLTEFHLREAVLGTLLESIRQHLRRRAGESLLTGVILFSNRHGFLGQTKEAPVLMEYLTRSRTL